MSDLHVEPVGPQQPRQHGTQVGVRTHHDNAAAFGDRICGDRGQPPQRSRHSPAAEQQHHNVSCGQSGSSGSAGIGCVTGWTQTLGRSSGRVRDAGNRAHRRSVGRRGQRKGHRSTRWPSAVGGALPGRQQCRPYGGAAIGRELRPSPDPVGHPHARRHERHRQRRRRRSGRVALRAQGSRGPRGGHRAAADLGRRASADAVSRRDGQGRRAVRGQQEDRHHRPRHRSVLPGQDRPYRDQGR